MKLHVSSEPQCVSVSCYDAPIRATASASLITDEDWFVNRVIVKPAAHRRNGLGGRLLERLKEEVAKRGAERLIVTPGGYDMALEDQVRFYEKRGFVEDVYEGDACLVWRPLPSGAEIWNTDEQVAQVYDGSQWHSQVIHILLHGVTICGVPCSDLPEGHRWVRQLHELRAVGPERRCAQCLDLKLRAAELISAEDRRARKREEEL